MTAGKTPILYISYDGMLEPLGQSQVLAYLERLAAWFDIHLISFEKKADWRDRVRREAARSRIAAAGIRWHPRRYHKEPSAPATAFDIATGSLAAIRLALRHRIRIVHARSYVPALMALAAKRATGASFLFDMRGFWADERVDGGLWDRSSRLYRTAKHLERRLLRSADHVVTLTHAGAAELARFPYLQGRMPPVTVIPTCADLDRFRPAAVPQDGPFVLGYIGSIGTWYLFDETLACFRSLLHRGPDARLLIVNRHEHDVIRDRLAAQGIDPSKVEILTADHSEMPGHIRRMSVGAAIIKPAYSKIASAPTKLAEYLGCGVPCLGNVDVGDMEQTLEGERVGVALRGFSGGEVEAGIDRLLALLEDPDLPRRCSEVARRLFSVDGGVRDYRQIYDALAK